ncbi:MAG: J domain-containing protein [Myxococcales bacterium]|nr:J domain-containing protein [Myxococcales bacterium]
MAKRRRDYYQILGVSRDASEADIKRAFRELARRHHPDVNPDKADAGEVFREINEAYAVLSEPSARARYDRFGAAGDAAAGGVGFGAVVDAAQEMIGDVLRRRKAKQRGRDLRYTLEVTFEEAAFGTSKTISVPDQPLEGQTDPGGGRRRQFTVVVPPATKDGAVKRIAGEGEPGRGGAAPGDLNVIVRVAEHSVFRRDGFDVRSEQLVSFSQAALGAVVDVPTLDGKVKMRIPEGTQPGRAFRIRGKGVPHGPGKAAQRGDHLVKVMVAVPTELSSRQRELIEELARTMGETRPSTSKKGLLDRMRSLLDE